MQDVIEAVSAILLHKEQVFVIQRQFHLRAFPGYYAFPGGKIDAEDESGDTLPDLPIPGLQQAALRRELCEELGWDLFKHWQQGNVESIESVGAALAPAGSQFRFNNHVFAIRLRQRVEFSTEPEEIAWSSWLSPTQVLHRFHNGSIHMAPPTRMAMEALEHDMNRLAVDYTRLHAGPDRIDRIEMIHGVSIVSVPSNTLPPATRTNALLLGDDDADRILVDPSPMDADTLAALIATLQPLSVNRLMVSHHHGDHHEFLPELVAALQVPVMMSATTRGNLARRMGADYLQNMELMMIAEGDPVTRWKGHVVRAYELPGHDDGMLGLAPDNRAWMFVADLVEAGTTVVIPEDVGDMRVYLASLQRVLDWAPGAIIPSHGGIQVGLHLVQQTLHHRLHRERQILDLWQNGCQDEETLYREIYPQLPDRLHRLALQNIRMHLRKLVADQAITAAHYQ